MEPLDRSYTS